MYFDGIVLKRRWAGEARNLSLLVAIGFNGEGYREILGVCEGSLKGLRLIISDACMGLAESAAEFFS